MHWYKSKLTLPWHKSQGSIDEESAWWTHGQHGHFYHRMLSPFSRRLWIVCLLFQLVCLFDFETRRVLSFVFPLCRTFTQTQNHTGHWIKRKPRLYKEKGDRYHRANDKSIKRGPGAWNMHAQNPKRLRKQKVQIFHKPPAAASQATHKLSLWLHLVHCPVLDVE